MYMFLVYLLILIFFLVRAINKKNYKIPIILVILLILITGLRKNGYDLNNYLINFLELNSIGDVIKTIIEPGYAFFSYLFKTIFFPDKFAFTLYMLFIATISITLKFETMNKFSKLPLLSFIFYFLCFFIYNDYTQIRHGIAIAFCFYSLQFMYKRNLKKYLIFVTMACLFHYSAIFFLPVYFIKNFNIDKKKLLILLALSFCLSFVEIKTILLFLNNNFFHLDYLSNKLNLYDTGNLSFFNSSNLFKIIFISMYFIFVYDKNDEKSKICFNTYLYGIILFNVLCSYSIIAYRSNAFFRMTEIILLSDYIAKISNIKYKWLNAIFVFCIICYYLYNFTIICLDPNYLIYTF